MKEVIILRGLPFSGKTTWAQKLKHRNDDFVIFNVTEEREKVLSDNNTLSKADVWKAVMNKFIFVLINSKAVIIDDENILASTILRLLFAINENASVIEDRIKLRIKSITTPWSICLKRAEESGCSESDIRVLNSYYSYCLKRNIIYSDEKDSKTDLQIH